MTPTAQLRAAAAPEGTTLAITAETIRARVDAAHRVLELAQAVETAETVRDVVAVALAEAAADDQDLSTVIPEFRRADAALVAARSAYTRAEQHLAEARVVVRLTA